MQCPLCNSGNISVYRTIKFETSVFRERKCKVCGCLFETDELIIGHRPARIVTSTGERARGGSNAC